MNGEDGGRREMEGFSLKSVTFAMTGLVLHDDLVLHCGHEIKRCLLLGRKAMTNLDSILKSKDITLPTKFHPKLWFFQ